MTCLRVPAPSALSTRIEPPCIWTISWTMARPSPLPDVVRVWAAVGLEEALEEASLVFFRNPDAGVGNSHENVTGSLRGEDMPGWGGVSASGVGPYREYSADVPGAVLWRRASSPP